MDEDKFKKPLSSDFWTIVDSISWGKGVNWPRIQLRQTPTV